jgi:hypothetical protein
MKISFGLIFYYSEQCPLWTVCMFILLTWMRFVGKSVDVWRKAENTELYLTNLLFKTRCIQIPNINKNLSATFKNSSFANGHWFTGEIDGHCQPTCMA